MVAYEVTTEVFYENYSFSSPGPLGTCDNFKLHYAESKAQFDHFAVGMSLLWAY